MGQEVYLNMLNRARHGKFFWCYTNGDRVDYAQFFSTDDKVLCFDDLKEPMQTLLTFQDILITLLNMII